MRRLLGLGAVVFVALLLAGCAALEISDISEIKIQSGRHTPTEAEVAAAASAGKVDPVISTTLLGILENKHRERVDLSRCGEPLEPKICEVQRLSSPIGYALRNRFLNIGVPIAEGLSRNADPVFREQLITLARWDSKPEVRATALVAVAGFGDPGHLNIFREAMVHLNVAVRFAALEGLVRWGQPDKAIPLLAAASERDFEPILRVYSAAGLARLKDPRGLEKLRTFLDDGNWLVRAMAAAYLGEHGKAEDYTLLVSRIGREQKHDFVVAEYCIAALKLFNKKAR